jgi:hypothetical protein
MSPKIRIACPATGSFALTGALVESETQVQAWLRQIKQMRAEPGKSPRLTEKQYVVAETTIELIVMEHREPSRSEIAEAVRQKGYRCCEETVRRAHQQLRDAGLLEWTNQYEIGWRMTDAGVRVRQARQTVNNYRFRLPVYVGLILPESHRRGTRRPKRPHSCDRLPSSMPRPTRPPISPGRGFDQQLAGVHLYNKSTSSPFTYKEPDLLRARAKQIEENMKKERAVRLSASRR